MDDLRKLAEAAVGGTWEVLDGRRVSVGLPCPPVEQCGYDSACIALTYPDRRFDHKANAAYIAACSPDRILKLLDVVEAARTYYERYAQDEADDGGAWENHHPHSSFTTGCSVEQAQDALALRRALAALSGAGTRTASDE